MSECKISTDMKQPDDLQPYNYSSTSTAASALPISKQVRIVLPVVDSSTQTESNFIFSAVTIEDTSTSIPSNMNPNNATNHSTTSTSQTASEDEIHHHHHRNHEKLTPISPMSVEFDRNNPIISTSSLSLKKDLSSSLSSNHTHHHERLTFKGLKKHKSELSSYVIALRPWSFPASITPVALGTCLAYMSQGACDVSIFVVTVITALCVHAAGNLVNTYFDFVRGIDTKKSDDRTIVDNILSLNDVATLGAVFYVAGCVGFMVLCLLSPARMEHLALIYFCGLSSSFFYTGGLGLKYIALGDILIVFTFGPLTVMFSHLSQTGQLSLTPLLYAIPLALNTEAILHCNNARDLEADKQAGIMTLAIFLGHSGSYILFCVLLFLPYLIFIVTGIHYSKWMLIPAASIVYAFRLEKEFRRKELAHMPQKVARLNLILGVLYIFSILLSESSLMPIMTFL